MGGWGGEWGGWGRGGNQGLGGAGWMVGSTVVVLWTFSCARGFEDL